MLVVYRTKDIPNTKSVFALWRKAVVEAGFDGLHIVVVDFYDISTPMEVGVGNKWSLIQTNTVLSLNQSVLSCDANAEC